MILCCWLPNFPLAVELQRRPALRDQAVVVGGAPVLAASAACRRLGVRPGQSRRQAEHCCPEAVFLPADEPAYRRAFARVLAVLDDFSPIVEAGGDARPGAPPDAYTAYLDASGLERLFGPAEALARRVMAAVQARTGFRPRLGLGSSRLVAWLAARLARPGQPVLVSPAARASFLADLPVALLPLDEAAQERLALLGIRRLSQFLRLPRAELIEQLGPAALAAHRALTGQDDERLVARWSEQRLREERDLEGECSTVAQLRLVAEPLVAALAERLRARYLTCRVVELELDFFAGVGGQRPVISRPKDATDHWSPTTQRWRGAWRLAQPSAAPAVLLEAVLALAGRCAAALRAGRVERAPTALALAVAELGAEAVGQPSLFQAHRQRRELAVQAVRDISRRLGRVEWKIEWKTVGLCRSTSLRDYRT